MTLPSVSDHCSRASVSARSAVSPLAAYERFLARADRVPLLIEVVRRYAPSEFETLLDELIVARAATGMTESMTKGMSELTVEKMEKERILGEVLESALREFSSHEVLKSTPIFVKLLGEFREWSESV